MLIYQHEPKEHRTKTTNKLTPLWDTKSWYKKPYVKIACLD